jgi:alginate O-acetyltransferase complex protein AlgI
MIFNSLDFAIFLPVVFLLYWFVFNKSLKVQNLLIVVASYVFYGWWDWRFLFLILFSTVVDYGVGIFLEKENNPLKRKGLLWTSILVNIGLLGFFKYYNFFLENFVASFSFFGMPINASSLDIILPVGISFYTFQTLSYSIDVYRKKLPATRNFIVFAAFVSFFPQLVAGPIERATNLLPQFKKQRNFNYNEAVEGLRQILWGLFKKVVIADNCARFADMAFNNYNDYSGSTLLLGAIFFTFQIYGDFSGYSDIAIGTSRLFGFNLMQNFAFPYFSRNIAEFWRRWHISLSTWFRDYLYIPLGGSRGDLWKKIRNIFIIFLVSGFWHGANWSFIVWGGLNALYFLPLMLQNKNRDYLDIIGANRSIPPFREIMGVFVTFGLTVVAWVFFRAETVAHAIYYLGKIFSQSLLAIPEFRPTNLMVLILLFMVIEWWGRKKEFAISHPKLPKAVEWLFYYTILFIIYFYGRFSENIEFIYFQF